MYWNDKIKELREDNDLTQAEMGKKLHISQRLVSYYENGKRDLPIEVLIEYAKYFKISTDNIVGLSERK